MVINKTSVECQAKTDDFDYAPCRNCGVATPMVSTCQTEHGLLCLSCQEQPGQAQGLETWLLQRRADLNLELLQVEEELALLRRNEEVAPDG